MPKFYIFFSLQVKCQILLCINSLKITYIPIILLLTVWERFIFQATEKKNCSKIVIYTNLTFYESFSEKWEKTICPHHPF
jgi:hypothetical protein